MRFTMLAPTLATLLLGLGCDTPDTVAPTTMPTTEELAEPFTLAAYRWANRPLLLFAPTEDHDAYRRMRGAILATQDAFAERDMVLVTIIGTNLGHAGDDPLTPDDIRALRVDHDVPPDAFAAILIGKDGGPKRRESAFIPIQTIYDQIDSMPMRQQEMRDR